MDLVLFLTLNQARVAVSVNKPLSKSSCRLRSHTALQHVHIASVTIFHAKNCYYIITMTAGNSGGFLYFFLFYISETELRYQL
jgi:hypothetical protein